MSRNRLRKLTDGDIWDYYTTVYTEMPESIVDPDAPSMDEWMVQEFMKKNDWTRELANEYIQETVAKAKLWAKGKK